MTIIGAVLGVCLIVTTVFAIVGEPAFLADSPEEAVASRRQLPSNLCSVVGEERLATLARDAVLNHSKRDRSSEASYRWAYCEFLHRGRGPS
jgi:hypothetical protein